MASWGKANGVDKAVKHGPMGRQVLKHGLNLRIAADIAIKYQRRFKLFGETHDAVFEALTHIVEGQFGPFALAGFGNAVGNGSV
jgi:hypothetical protein